MAKLTKAEKDKLQNTQIGAPKDKPPLLDSQQDPSLAYGVGTMGALIGASRTYQGVPVGPSKPGEYTGKLMGRPTPGTKLAIPGNQFPAAPSGSNSLATPKGAPMQSGSLVPKGAPVQSGSLVPSSGKVAPYNVNYKTPSSMARAAGPLALYSLADAGVAKLTGKGINQRIGEGLGGAVGNLMYGDTNQGAMTQQELASVSQGVNPALLGEQGGALPSSEGGSMGGGMYGGSGQLPGGYGALGANVAALTEADPSQFQEGSLPTMMISGAQALQGAGDAAYGVAENVAEFVTGAEFGEPKQVAPSLESLEGVAPTAPVVPSAGAMEGLSGEEGSAQREYYDYVRGGGQMTPEMLSQLQETAEGMNTTFDPATGYSREAFLAAQDPALRTVNDLVGFNPADKGQSLSDFMAYRDDPSQRTQMTMDAQGRLQRSPATPMGAPSAEGEQPVEQSEPKALTQGDYRNILRAQGVEGSAQIVLAQQMMEEDEQKRQAGALAQERAQQIINQGNQSNQPKDTESTSFQKKKAEWLEREELLREDNATDEEIAARRRAFLYGDRYDAYLYEDNGGEVDVSTAKQLMQEAGRDPIKARQLAKERGYSL